MNWEFLNNKMNPNSRLFLRIYCMNWCKFLITHFVIIRRTRIIIHAFGSPICSVKLSWHDIVDLFRGSRENKQNIFCFTYYRSRRHGVQKYIWRRKYYVMKGYYDTIVKLILDTFPCLFLIFFFDWYKYILHSEFAIIFLNILKRSLI